ncbi:hypothetical protein Bbelb_177420 [Branchiostoma belcheri]|nr:hypothetical protein Bbelb_177420 [Branchiostoma belcheri]
MPLPLNLKHQSYNPSLCTRAQCTVPFASFLPAAERAATDSRCQANRFCPYPDPACGNTATVDGPCQISAARTRWAGQIGEIVGVGDVQAQYCMPRPAYLQHELPPDVRRLYGTVTTSNDEGNRRAGDSVKCPRNSLINFHPRSSWRHEI